MWCFGKWFSPHWDRHNNTDATGSTCKPDSGQVDSKMDWTLRALQMQMIVYYSRNQKPGNDRTHQKTGHVHLICAQTRTDKCDTVLSKMSSWPIKRCQTESTLFQMLSTVTVHKYLFTQVESLRPSLFAFLETLEISADLSRMELEMELHSAEQNKSMWLTSVDCNIGRVDRKSKTISGLYICFFLKLLTPTKASSCFSFSARNSMIRKQPIVCGHQDPCVQLITLLQLAGESIEVWKSLTWGDKKTQIH